MRRFVHILRIGLGKRIELAENLGSLVKGLLALGFGRL